MIVVAKQDGSAQFLVKTTDRKLSRGGTRRPRGFVYDRARRRRLPDDWLDLLARTGGWADVDAETAATVLVEIRALS